MEWTTGVRVAAAEVDQAGSGEGRAIVSSSSTASSTAGNGHPRQQFAPPGTGWAWVNPASSSFKAFGALHRADSRPQDQKGFLRSPRGAPYEGVSRVRWPSPSSPGYTLPQQAYYGQQPIMSHGWCPPCATQQFRCLLALPVPPRRCHQ